MSENVPAPFPVYVVRAADPSLRADALERLLHDLLHGEDRSLTVEDLSVPGGRGGGDPDADADGDEDRAANDTGSGGDVADELPATAAGAVVGAAIDAASTPPFMTARRIVVLRDVGNLSAADVPPIAAYLADPMPTSVLVLVAGGGGAGRPAAGPRSLSDALKRAGATTIGPDAEGTADVLSAAAADVEITLRADARAAIVARLGEDAARVRSLMGSLAAAYGPGARLGADEVEPYLGEAGQVPAYLLSNALESGDAPTALEILNRVLHATSSRQPRAAHPLQVMAMLHNRYRRLLRLDDPSIRSAEDAAAVLSALGKAKVSPGAARHALSASRALGTDGLRKAFGYLHHADLALKGGSGLAAETVLEVLVVRLAALSAGGARQRRPQPSTAGRR